MFLLRVPIESWLLKNFIKTQRFKALNPQLWNSKLICSRISILRGLSALQKEARAESSTVVVLETTKKVLTWKFQALQAF